MGLLFSFPFSLLPTTRYSYQMKKYVLEIIVFITGAGIMAFEIIGSRILSPYLGSSIVVWTSVIGVVLAGLSLGYWLGGRLADKDPHPKKLGYLILSSGISILIVLAISDFVMLSLLVFSSAQLASFLGSMVIFFVPSVFLGSVSPYATRLQIQTVETSGKTLGKLGAIGTIGSLVGTFLTGFVLIAHFGTTKLIILIACTLILLSFLAFSGKIRVISAIVILISAVSWGWLNIESSMQKIAGFIDFDTQYGRYSIQTLEKADGEAVRVLSGGGSLWHSSMIVERPNEVNTPYVLYYRLAEFFAPEMENVLLIGGGGYSAAKDFLVRNGKANMDVVEIDAKLTEMAKEYFFVPEDDRLRMFDEDGRRFVRKTNTIYDAVMIDAFANSFAIPHHLTTKEFLEEIKNKLSPEGVVISNIISPLDGGAGGDYLRAQYKTFSSVFDRVIVLQVIPGANPSIVQNVAFIATNSATPEIETARGEYEFFLKNIVSTEILADGILFTDDFAPSDQFVLRMI